MIAARPFNNACTRVLCASVSGGGGGIFLSTSNGSLPFNNVPGLMVGEVTLLAYAASCVKVVVPIKNKRTISVRKKRFIISPFCLTVKKYC